eukprot:tig00000955_g5782.t1
MGIAHDRSHRLAKAHREKLVGKLFKATSPNGRFAEGARQIDGKVLEGIEPHGKNLFYFFRGKADAKPVVVHIHFGMSGRFVVNAPPGPEVKPTTRLRLEGADVVADLSAMTCQHGGPEFYEEQRRRLGPDPLRDDADKELLWDRMRSARGAPVGKVIMDQSCVAGIGNIYRAEILLVAGVHPDQKATTVPREAFERIWDASCRLLRLGVIAGAIITRDPRELGKTLRQLRGPERRYVYNHAACGRCGGPVTTWPIAGRTAYACARCQPLDPAEAAGTAKKAAAHAPRARGRRQSKKEGKEAGGEGEGDEADSEASPAPSPPPPPPPAPPELDYPGLGPGLEGLHPLLSSPPLPLASERLSSGAAAAAAAAAKLELDGEEAEKLKKEEEEVSAAVWRARREAGEPTTPRAAGRAAPGAEAAAAAAPPRTRARARRAGAGNAASPEEEGRRRRVKEEEEEEKEEEKEEEGGKPVARGRGGAGGASKRRARAKGVEDDREAGEGEAGENSKRPRTRIQGKSRS